MKAAGNGFNFDDGEPRIVPWEQALATGEQWVAEKSKNGDLDLDDRHSRKHYLLMHVTIENLAPGMCKPFFSTLSHASMILLFHNCDSAPRLQNYGSRDKRSGHRR
jgi:hypothetical protein